MKRKEVELIILSMAIDGQNILLIKIYKDGTISRSGLGSLPSLYISFTSVLDHSKYFDTLLEKIPQEMLEKPLGKIEKDTPNGFIEYRLGIFGESTNGEKGEQAQWAKKMGLYFKLDRQSDFKHPTLTFLDDLTLDATELTNEIYFDVFMVARWAAKSSKLPKSTMISRPQNVADIPEIYENFISQMLQSARKWDINQYTKNKTYDLRGTKTVLKFKHDTDTYEFEFVPVDTDNPQSETKGSESSAPTKKAWWKF
jgi:hypothetical protein